MVYCGECGEQNPDGRKYCWKCGKPLYLGTGVQSGERNQSTEEPPGVLQDDIEREAAELRADRNGEPSSSRNAQTVAERAAARMKSYTGASIIVFILYYLFWLPGFLANIVYYKQAKRMEKTAEQSLPGVGCLSFMLNLHLVALLLMVPIAVIAILALLGPQIANIFSKVETSAAIATPAPGAYSALATATLFPTLTRAASTLAITTVQPTAKSGSELLLTDNFVDNRNRWNTDDGKLYFENSAYHIKATREEYSLWGYCNECGVRTDFAYEALIEKVEGSDDDVYGLAFRSTKDGHYAFSVTGNGWYEFVKYQGEQWHEIIGFVPSDAIVKGNSKNRLRVVCRGSHFEFHINDRLVGYATDETFSTGYVGVGVGKFGQHIKVWDVKIWSPDAGTQ